MTARRLLKRMGSSFIAFLVTACPLSHAWGAETDTSVSVISDRDLGPAARHGLKKVMAALEARGTPAREMSDLSLAESSVEGHMLIVASLASRHVDLRSTEPYLYRGEIPASDVRDRLRYSIEADGAPPAETIGVTVTSDNEPPTVAHVPITTARPRRPLTLTAQVRDASGVRWVRLRYRSVTQFQDYQTLDMRPTGVKNEYRAVVPAQAIDPKWDFMYFVEVMDTVGNGSIYPHLEEETPYVVVELQR